MKNIKSFDEFVLESLNTEQLKIVNNYLNLKKAINDPNYRDTAHTQAALIAAKKKVKELIKSNSLRKDVLSMLTPSDVDDITNESWHPSDTGTIDKKELNDEKFIASFIEYNGLSKLVLDIWKWAESNFKIYPSKLTVQGMVYNLPKNRTCEIMFGKNDEMTMYMFYGLLSHMRDKQISTNLVDSQKFSYKTFKEWLK